MKVNSNINTNLIQPTTEDSVPGINTPKTADPQPADAIEKDQSGLIQRQEAAAAAATAAQEQAAQEDSGFDYTSLIPFGIGNWFDGEGSFASDLGKTLLSVACPIPFVGGLLADWGGDWLGNAIVNTADWIGGAVSDAASWIGGAAEDAAGAVADAAGDVAGAVGDAADAVADAVGDAAGAVADAVSDALDW